MGIGLIILIVILIILALLWVISVISGDADSFNPWEEFKKTLIALGKLIAVLPILIVNKIRKRR